MLSRQPTLKRSHVPSRLAHVQLVVWLHADSQDARSKAVRQVISQINDTYTQELDGEVAFRKEIASGRISTQTVVLAVLRDLNDETCIATPLADALYILSTYSSPGLHSVMEDTPSDVRVLMAGALAACRREVCRTGSVNPDLPLDTLASTALSLLLVSTLLFSYLRH